MDGVKISEITGEMIEKNKPCIICNGKGYIKHSNNPNLIGSINCLECNGTGLDEEEFETKDCKCGHCGGLVKIFIKDEIMKALKDQSQVRLSLSREKVANVLFKSITGQSKIEMIKLLKRRLIPHEFNICECDMDSKCNLHIWIDCKEHAATLIENQKDLFEVVKE